MAQSVGMFQRPVEYRVNCLELTYEFSGLNLFYYSPGSGSINVNTNMSYFIKSINSLCFSKNNGITEIKIKPKFIIDSIHNVSLFTFEESWINKVEMARNAALSSYLNKVAFYQTLSNWIKNELVLKGFNQTEIQKANFIFDLTVSSPYATRLDGSEFYLKSGSSLVEGGVDKFIYQPTGENQEGHTTWRSDYFDGADYTLDPNSVIHSGGSFFIVDAMMITEQGLTVNSENIVDYGSINSINNYYNSLI